ncbi:MAG: hypothetical protein KDK55_00725 [Chlamydiia bacterium]|nr:hypothetical protein [Chlamydiia bacterium]
MFPVRHGIWDPIFLNQNQQLHEEEKICSSNEEWTDKRTHQLATWKELLKHDFSQLEPQEFKLLESEWKELSKVIFPFIREGKDLHLAFRWAQFLFRHSQMSANDYYVAGSTLGYLLLTLVPSYFKRICKLDKEIQESITFCKPPPLQFVFQFKEKKDQNKIGIILQCFEESLETKCLSAQTGKNTWTLHYKTPRMVITLVFGDYHPDFLFENCFLKLENNNLIPSFIQGSGGQGLLFSALRIVSPIEITKWKEETFILKTIEAVASGYFLYESPSINGSLPKLSKDLVEKWIQRWAILDPNFAFSLYLHGRIHFPEIFPKQKIETLPSSGLFSLFEIIYTLESKEDEPLSYIPYFLELCVLLTISTHPNKVEYFNGNLPTLLYKGDFLLSVPLFSDKKGIALKKLLPSSCFQDILPICSYFFSLSNFENPHQHLLKNCQFKINPILFLDSKIPILQYLSLHLLSLIDTTSTRHVSVFLLLFPSIRKWFAHEWPSLSSLMQRAERILDLSKENQIPSTHAELILSLFEANKNKIALELIAEVLRTKIPIEDNNDWFNVLIEYTRRVDAYSLPLWPLARLLIKLISDPSSTKISEEIFELAIYVMKRLTDTNLKQAKNLYKKIFFQKKFSEDQINRLKSVSKVFGYKKSLKRYEVSLAQNDFEVAKIELLNHLLPQASLPFSTKENLIRLLIQILLEKTNKVDSELFERWMSLRKGKGYDLFSYSEIRYFFFECVLKLEFPCKSSSLKRQLFKSLPDICKNLTDCEDRSFDFLWKIYVLGIDFPKEITFETAALNILIHAIDSPERDRNTINLLYRSMIKQKSKAPFIDQSKYRQFLSDLVLRSIKENAFDDQYFSYLMENLHSDDALMQKAIIHCHKNEQHKKVIEMINVIYARDLKRQDGLIYILAYSLSTLHDEHDPDFSKILMKMEWINKLKDKYKKTLNPTIILFILVSSASKKSNLVKNAADLFIKFYSFVFLGKKGPRVTLQVIEALLDFCDCDRLWKCYQVILNNKLLSGTDLDSVFSAVTSALIKKSDIRIFDLLQEKKITIQSNDQDQEEKNKLQIIYWFTTLEQVLPLVSKVREQQRGQVIEDIKEKLSYLKKMISFDKTIHIQSPKPEQDLHALLRANCLGFKSINVIMLHCDMGIKMLAEKGGIFVVSPKRFSEELSTLTLKFITLLLQLNIKKYRSEAYRLLNALLDTPHRSNVWESTIPILLQLLKGPFNSTKYRLIVKISCPLVFLHADKYPFMRVLKCFTEIKDLENFITIFATQLLVIGWDSGKIGKTHKTDAISNFLLDRILSLSPEDRPTTLIYELIKIARELRETITYKNLKKEKIALFSFYSCLCKYLSGESLIHFSSSTMKSIDEITSLLSDPRSFELEVYKKLFHAFLSLLFHIGEYEIGSISKLTKHTMTMVRSIVLQNEHKHQNWVIDHLKSFFIQSIKSTNNIDNKKAYLIWSAFIIFYLRRHLFRKWSQDKDFMIELKKLATSHAFEKLIPLLHSVKLNNTCEHGIFALMMDFQSTFGKLGWNLIVLKNFVISDVSEVFKLQKELFKTSNQHLSFAVYAFNKISCLTPQIKEKSQLSYLFALFMHLKSLLIEMLTFEDNVTNNNAFAKLFGEHLISLLDCDTENHTIQQMIFQNFEETVKAGVFKKHYLFVYAYAYMLVKLDSVTLVQLSEVLIQLNTQLTSKQNKLAQSYQLAVVDHWCLTRMPESARAFNLRSEKEHKEINTANEELNHRPLFYWLL